MQLLPAASASTPIFSSTILSWTGRRSLVERRARKPRRNIFNAYLFSKIAPMPGADDVAVPEQHLEPQAVAVCSRKGV